MAERVVRQLIDDITGDEIPDGKGEKIEFSVRGVQYVIDLNDSNVAKFDKALQPYIDAGAKVTGQRGRPRGTSSTRAASGSGRSKEELQAVRDWAAKNGHEVSPRGRISAPVLEAFDAAHAPGGAKPAFSN